MLTRRLRSRIFINLAAFLFLAVLLSDYLIIVIVQKMLIMDKIRTADALLVKFEEKLKDMPGPGVTVWPEPSLVCGFFLIAPDIAYRFGEPVNDIDINLAELTQRAIDAKMTSIQYAGDTWGVFWKQKKYLIVSKPFSANHHHGSGGTVIFQLGDIHKILRSANRFAAFYLIVNGLVLAFLCFYRFSRLIFRPLDKIIHIAKAYKDSDSLQFISDKRSHEFNELSSALNRMIHRIETDKEKLRESLKKLKEAHEELKKTQAEMVRAEKMASIGRLSAGIAHEIGNPIGIVLGYLGLLQKRNGIQQDAVALDYLARAENEINRINEIIRQMLDFSRTPALRFCKISIHQLVCDIVAVMRDQPLMRHIQIEYELSSPHDAVYADYHLMRQVLMNLLINAADSIAVSNHPTCGRILISTAFIPQTHPKAIGGEPTLQLAVMDNGTGIAEKDFDSIFDPFYTTKEPGKGTGLGLSVSYTIVEQAGGKIFADSEIGKGTTMTILLPLMDQRPDKSS